MEKELDYMLGKFPLHRAKVVELFNNNPDFKALCDDYWLYNYGRCKLTGNLENGTIHENSHKMLSINLEQKVLKYLST